jgi:hypothetical protein
MGKRTAGGTKQTARHQHRGGSGRGDPALAVFDGFCLEVLATQARDVLRSGDPLQAELWASYMLGLWSGLPLIGEPDPAAAVGGQFVSVARRRRGLESALCLRALAVVAGGQLGARAGEAAQAAGGQTPSWFDAIGASRPTQAWRASDVWGDQDSVMVGFDYPVGASHTIVVLIDHPLGGIAKDVAVLSTSLAEVVATWTDGDPAIELVEEPVGVAAGRVMEAVDWTEQIAAPVTDDYRDTRALLQARLGPLACPLPEAEPMTPGEREALVKAFLADPAGLVYARDSDAWFLLDALVDYRCDHHGRDPLRWSGGSIELFLLDWVPRKLSAADDVLTRAPEVLRAWVPWAAGRAGLPDRLATESAQVIDELEGEFREALGDTERWGPAKRLVMGMLAAGIDPTDEESVDGWLASQMGHPPTRQRQPASHLRTRRASA